MVQEIRTAIRACEPAIADGASVYLRGSHTMGLASRVSDIDLVVVLSDDVGDDRRAASRLADSFIELGIINPGTRRLDFPKVAFWHEVDSYYRSEAVFHGIGFFEFARLLAGEERRTRAVFSAEQLAKSAWSALLRSTMAMVYDLPTLPREGASVMLNPGQVGRVLRALWVERTGIWLASLDVLLSLCAEAFGGAIASIRENNPHPLVGPSRLNATEVECGRFIDQIAHLIGLVSPVLGTLAPHPTPAGQPTGLATDMHIPWATRWLPYGPDSDYLTGGVAARRIGAVAIPSTLFHAMSIEASSDRFRSRVLAYVGFNRLNKLMDIAGAVGEGAVTQRQQVLSHALRVRHCAEVLGEDLGEDVVSNVECAIGRAPLTAAWLKICAVAREVLVRHP